MEVRRAEDTRLDRLSLLDIVFILSAAAGVAVAAVGNDRRRWNRRGKGPQSLSRGGNSTPQARQVRWPPHGT